MTVSFYKAEALIGSDITASSDIAAFITRYLNVVIDPNSTPWTGYFAAAALTAAGYQTPSAFGAAALWANYGSPATSLQIGTVILMPADQTGYQRVGIVTGEAADGAPIVLVGDYGAQVVEVPLYLAGATATYINPILASDAARIQSVAAATGNGNGIFAEAEGFVGDTVSTNPSDIQSFLDNILPYNAVQVTAHPWSGAFTRAALGAAGFAIPPHQAAAGANWRNYGQPVTDAQLNVVAVFPQSPDNGYVRSGIITGQTSDGQWVVLMGDLNGVVVEIPMDLTGCYFRRPISPDAAANAIANATGMSASAASAYSPTASSNDAADIATALAAASALAALLGQSQTQRQGPQTGNTDTPESNQGHAQSGPMPCGGMHDDVQGSPGNYSPTQCYSPVTRMPTHEPWTGHPIACSTPSSGQDGQQQSTGQSTNGGGTGGGGSPVRGGGGGGAAGVDPSVGGTPTPSPGSFSNSKFASNNNFQINSAVAVKRFMSDLGLTYDQAVGLVSNMSYESKGLTAGQQELGQAPGRGGLGWEQWTGPRRTAFVNFVKSKGGSIYDPEMNYQFAVHELKTTESRALAALKTAKTASQAVQIVEQRLERAGVVAMGSRLAYIPKVQKAYSSQVTQSSHQQSQGANTASAASAAAQAQATAASQQQTAQQQTSSKIPTPPPPSGQQPSVPGGGTLNRNKYNPNDPSGTSQDPDAGKGPVSKDGETQPADSGGSGGGSGSGSGGGGSGGSSGGGGSGASSSAATGTPGSSSGLTPNNGPSTGGVDQMTVDGKPTGLGPIVYDSKTGTTSGGAAIKGAPGS